MEFHHDRSGAEDAAEWPDEGELLTAAEAARVLRVARRFVYEHASELGGWRLLGERGPWRFARQELLERCRPGQRGASPQGRGRARKQTHTPSGVPILPSEPRREAL
jgi:hypothetical protein